MYDYVFITNVPAFYKVNLFNELSKTIKIKVIFISSFSDIRNNDFYGNNFDFDFDFISHKSYEKRNKFVVFFKLTMKLSRLKFKKIVYSGWESIETLPIAFLISRKKNCVVVESSIKETKSHGVLWMIKRFFLGRMSLAFPSGLLQKEILYKAEYKGLIQITHGVGISNIEKKTTPFAKKKKDKPQTIKFIYVGRLSEEKNLKSLIVVFNQLPYELVMVGDGPIREELKNIAKNNISFLGYINNSLLLDIYQCCDCFILPSFSEPWGLVVEEALASGLPVIVSENVGCNKDLVSPEVGIVFKLGHVDYLRSAVEKMAENLSYFKFGAEQFDNNELIQKQVVAYIRARE